MNTAHLLDLIVQAVTGAVALAGALAPVVVPLALSHLDEKRRATVLAATKGAAITVAFLASKNPSSTLANSTAMVLARVEEQVGKLNEKHKVMAAQVVEAIHSDPTKPDLAPGGAAEKWGG
jgi:hypothetical protein